MWVRGRFVSIFWGRYLSYKMPCCGWLFYTEDILRTGNLLIRSFYYTVIIQSVISDIQVLQNIISETSHPTPKDWTQRIPSLNSNNIYAHVFPVNNGYKKSCVVTHSTLNSMGKDLVLILFVPMRHLLIKVSLHPLQLAMKCYYNRTCV